MDTLRTLLLAGPDPPLAALHTSAASSSATRALPLQPPPPPQAPPCVCDPLEIDGHAFSPFWGMVFGECIYTPKQQFAIICGLVSIVLYGVALVPQFKLNYQRKSVEGLSWGLFAVWTLGDLCNTAGAFLTQQFATQRWTGVYFLFTEFLCLAQILYYTRIYPRLYPSPPPPPPSHHPAGEPHVRHAHDMFVPPHSHPHPHPKPGRPRTATESTPLLRDLMDEDGATPTTTITPYKSAGVPVAVALLCALSRAVVAMPVGPVVGMVMKGEAPPLCNAAPDLPPHIVSLGSVLAWCSGLFYFFSRVPQIRTNYELQSVAGISLSLFGITLAANVLYGLSVVPRLDEIASTQKFVASTLPYLVGSVGTLVFDAVIMAQAYWYTNVKPHVAEEVEVPDDRDVDPAADPPEASA
ncbi:hypothetical protein GGF31_004906 [Allomyces arbusculus]|nr:hypothetical protein GGF31_004906 [Allomyces arbusculus]